MILDGDTARKCLACGKIYVDRKHGLIRLVSTCPGCGSKLTVPFGFN